jgi:hypothetical protein
MSGLWFPPATELADQGARFAAAVTVLMLAAELGDQGVKQLDQRFSPTLNPVVDETHFMKRPLLCVAAL